MLHLAYLSAKAQSFSKGNLDDLFLKCHRYLPHLDSTMDVTKLSADGRNALIYQMKCVNANQFKDVHDKIVLMKQKRSLSK